MKPLTEIQKVTLEYIMEYIEKHGIVPTYMEIADFFNVSFHAISYRVQDIEKKGYLARRVELGRRATSRGITVLANSKGKPVVLKFVVKE